jgi:hypothetical protein
MLEMSRAAGDVAFCEGDKSMPWDCESFDDSSYTIDIEKYIATTPCRATNLYAWSRFILSYPRQDKDEDGIPLASIQPAWLPYSDAGFSNCETEDTESGHNSGFLADTSIGPEPLVFNMRFQDGTHTKQLDYSTFARWEHVEALLEGLEGGSASFKQLWDVREAMPICRGDWDARVHPGMEIDVACWKTDRWECGSALSSDDEEDEEMGAQNWEDMHMHGRRWRFGAWKRKVEQDTARSRPTLQEPSRRTVLLGMLAMATFLGVVVFFCTV